VAGTIVINNSCSYDLRTIDFAWLTYKLRLKTGEAAKVLSKVLWSCDEAGMDMLRADDLQEGEFKLFAQAMREVLETSRASTKGSSGLTQFLELLLRSIEDDPRH
jgi:hypothetical protein